ncbi:hypothetical protein DFH94DRAFT_811491 [Russula ochroleuca]|uniref:Uncharacterized protein n=1 Tax=Russula ochroleuca TaxID=152965 RepID=A0A9P5MPE1_9AGAM|nr:hypothetical protein DFH94DRAFT_811491 [Russula ochroleuca]
MSQGPTTRSRLSLQKKAREAQSASPQQAATEPKTGQMATPEADKQTSQKGRYKEARKYLAKKGLLEASAPCNLTALANVLKTLASTLKLPKKNEAALSHLAVQRQTLSQFDLDDKLDNLGTRLEKKITEQGELMKAAEKMEEATKRLGDLITKVTDTTSQMALSANTYRDALLKNPALKHTKEGPASSDPAIGTAVERKERQVLLQLTEAQVAMLSQQDILEKATNALKQIKMPPPPDDTTIMEVIKLRRGMLIMQFKTKDAAEWIQNPEAELSFSTHFLDSVVIKPRQFTLLIPRAPTTLDPGISTHLREIEEANGLTKTHNSQGQVDQAGEKTQTRPKGGTHHLHTQRSQCHKQMHQGQALHMWNKEEKDTWGTCGREHRSKDCTEANKRHCISCKVDTHASWDRTCPEFAKKCSWYDQKHPDNLLKYFPTDDDWTRETRPEQIPILECFPARFAVASLPPQGKSRRDLPTREIEQRPKCAKGKGKMLPGQARVDQFMTPSQRASSTMYQGVLVGLGCGDAKGDLEDEEKAH